MRNIKWIFGAILLSSPVLSLHAASLQNTNEYCLFLGSEPSLIVKVSQHPSSKLRHLPPQLLKNFSTSSAVYTRARAMSGDAFILSFKPSKSLQARLVSPGCYAQSDIDALTAELTKRPNVIYAFPNLLLKPAEISHRITIPVIGPKQWDMKTPPGGIYVEGAFTQTLGNPNAIVAVLDTGILTNLSLAPNILAGVTFNNNGEASNGASPSCDATCDGYDHGTHVAGTVAASGVTAYGENIYGVAPSSSVLPVNVFTKFTTEFNCGSPSDTPCLLSYTSDQINALAWLSGTSFTSIPAAPYVTTVNMSLGANGPCDEVFQAAIDVLVQQNISFAVAAGNENTVTTLKFPANCSNVMTVAATGPLGYGAFYSNYGAEVTFAAPGGNDPTDVTFANQIYSTIANGYGYKQGTSMASPHAAGLSSLLYSIDPTLTPALVKSLIANSVTAFPSGGPGDSCVTGKPCGTGIINANAAVIATIAQEPSVVWAANLTATPGIISANVTWQAASWNPIRSTPFVYTVSLNGTAYASCIEISGYTCTFTNLQPDTTYSVYVSATDIRRILSPVQTSTVAFTTNPYIPPTLSHAARNPFLTTQAFIYVSSPTNLPADAIVVNNIPGGATATYDSSRQRYVISNITTPRTINNVSLTVTYGTSSKTTNTVTIPNIL